MGNAIGEQNIKLAKILNYIGLSIAFMCTLLQGILSYFYSHKIALFYTQDLDVVPILSNVLKSTSVPIVIFAFTLVP